MTPPLLPFVHETLKGGTSLSVYRIHFTWNNKEVTLRSKGLDLTHPYFVSITEIYFPEDKKIIIDPSEDEVRKRFGKADHLMIPFQKVSLIEEVKEEEQLQESRVRSFKLVTDQDEGNEPEPETDDDSDDDGR